MKRTVLRNWMAAALLAGACCGLVACDKDNDGPGEPGVTAVQGNYTGTMTIVKAAPLDDTGENPGGIAVSATVSADNILFEDFPVRDLIAEVVGEETADQIAAQLGQVDYAVPYTALMSDDKTSVRLTLNPEPLKLSLPDNSGNEGGEGDEGDATSLSEGGSEIEVTITADAEGSYTLESKSLSFGLAATTVKLNGEEISFTGLNLAFVLTK